MRWRASIALLCCAACGSAPATSVPEPPGWAAAFDAAFAYLSSAREVGLDVVVVVQIVGGITGDRRADRFVAERRPMLAAADLARFGRLLEIPKPPLPGASLDRTYASPTRPDPGMVLADGGAALIDRCLADALACRLDEDCRAFVEREHQWGYVLTHQAAWLLFARWAGCSFGLDLEMRRRVLAANLVKEIEADPVVSDLAAERLAMLGHLGFASSLDPTWIAALLRAQDPRGCWPVRPGGACHAHPSALAMWALALARAAGRWPSLSGGP